MRRIVVLFGFIFLAGCNDFPTAAPYALVSASDGAVYRINKKTGEIALVTRDGVKIIGAANDPLGIRNIKVGDTIDGEKITGIKKVKD